MSALKSISQVQTKNREINQLQQNITQAVNPLLQNPANNSILLTGQKLAVGPNTINTGLNRVLQGWIVVGSNAVANIYDNQATNQNAATTLILVSSAAVTVNLLVF